MTGFDSKRQMAQAKVQEEMQAFYTKRNAAQAKVNDDDDTQVYADTLLIVYQSGFADGKRAAQKQEPTCPECKAGVLYECVACSSNNYPPKPEQEPVKLHEAVINAWSLREVYFDEDGEPSMHRSPPAAQPEQEPVAWAVQGITQMIRGEFAELDAKSKAKRIGGTCVAYPLYTAPPQRCWVGLTDEDKKKIATVAGCTEDDDGHIVTEIFRLAEAKLKEKNGH